MINRSSKFHQLIVAFFFNLSIVNVAFTAPDEDPWIRVDNGTLAFSTNLTGSEALELEQSIRLFSQFSKTFLPARENYSIPLQLIVFANKTDFDDTVKPRKFASYTNSELDGVLIVAAPSTNKETDLLENLKHELAHYHMRHTSINYPLWYEEGMATMLSEATLTLKDKTIHAEFKTPKPTASFPLKRSTKMVRKAWLVEHLKRRNLRNINLRIIHNFYNDSHRLANFFHFNENIDPRFSIEALNRHLSNQSNSLFSSLDATPKELVDALWKHQSQLKTPQRLTFSADQSKTQVTTSALTKTEVHRTLSAAAEKTNLNGAIDHQLQIVENDDKDHISMLELARLHSLSGNSKSSDNYLSMARKLRGPNPAIQVAEASLLVRSCEPSSRACINQWKEAADLIREALESDPDNIEAIFSLGVIELYSGQPGRAVNYLKVAEAHAPWSPRINFHLGEAFRLLGDPIGKTYLIKARNWAHSNVWRRLAEKSLDNYG